MENQKKVKVSYKERLKEPLLLDKRNCVAFISFSAFALFIGMVAFLSSFLLIGMTENYRRIFVAVISPLIFVFILAVLLSIRFYKTRTIIATTRKYILVNQIITYIYLGLILGWIITIMLSRKYYDASNPDLSSLGRNLLTFMIFRNIARFLGIGVMGLTVGAISYNIYIVKVKDTKEPYKNIEKKIEETIAHEEAQGTLVSESIPEINEENK